MSCKPCAADGNALLAPVGKVYGFGETSLKFILLLIQEVEISSVQGGKPVGPR